MYMLLGLEDLRENDWQRNCVVGNIVTIETPSYLLPRTLSSRYTYMRLVVVNLWRWYTRRWYVLLQSPRRFDSLDIPRKYRIGDFPCAPSTNALERRA